MPSKSIKRYMKKFFLLQLAVTIATLFGWWQVSGLVFFVGAVVMSLLYMLPMLSRQVDYRTRLDKDYNIEVPVDVIIGIVFGAVAALFGHIRWFKTACVFAFGSSFAIQAGAYNIIEWIWTRIRPQDVIRGTGE